VIGGTRDRDRFGCSAQASKFDFLGSYELISASFWGGPFE
jgi:hypothetical protein